MQKLKINLTPAKAKKLLSGGSVSISYRALSGGALCGNEEQVPIYLKADQVAKLNDNPKQIVINFDNEQIEKHVMTGGSFWKRIWRGIKKGAKAVGKILKPALKPALGLVSNVLLDTVPGSRQALDLFKQGVEQLPGGKQVVGEITKVTDGLTGSGIQDAEHRADYILDQLKPALVAALEAEAAPSKSKRGRPRLAGGSLVAFK